MTTKTRWIPNGDLAHLCALLYAMAANNQEITTQTVLEQYTGSFRTDAGMDDMLRRIENSIYGVAYKTDDNKVARMNTFRAFMSEAGFEFDGPLVLTEAIIRSGPQRTRTGTGSDDNTVINTNFTHVFTVDQITKLDRFLNIKPYALCLTKPAIAAICGISTATVTRYFNGGKGYENGPPLVFIQQLEAAIDMEFFDKNFINLA